MWVFVVERTRNLGEDNYFIDCPTYTRTAGHFSVTAIYKK